MPEVIQAPTDNAMEQTVNGDSPPSEPATQAHPLEFPEAPPDASGSPGGQLDLLLDMDVPVTVILGTTRVPVRRLLQLGPGSVIQLEKSVEAPAELFLKDSKFAEAEIVVVDNQFAVRLTQIIKADAASGAK